MAIHYEADTQRSTPPGAILEFRMSGHRFGVELGCVSEVVPAVAVTPLPQAPPIVEGVIDVRGRIVPVLDVRERFGLPARPPALSDRLVLAQSNGRDVALRVDETPGLVLVTEEAWQRAQEFVAGAGLVEGVARMTDGLIVIHDLRRFLTQAEGRALDTALRHARREVDDA